jgi:hypothetical protein
LLKNPLHDAGAHAKLSADLVNAITLCYERHDLNLDRGLNPEPT